MSKTKPNHTGIDDLTPRDPHHRSASWFGVAFGVLYHIWFFVVMLFSIALTGPFLWSNSRRDEDYPRFYAWAQRWARVILWGMGFFFRAERPKALDWQKPYMVVANHSSELDIMASFSLIQSPVVFIGKSELAKLPIFGFFFKRSSIVVDRRSMRSRRQAMIEAGETLKRGHGMCIYPEGGIPPDPAVLLGRFKLGAFQLAIEHEVDILPLTFANHRKHFPYILKGGYPGVLKVTLHEPISTKGMKPEEAQALADQVHALILQELKRYRNIS